MLSIKGIGRHRKLVDLPLKHVNVLLLLLGDDIDLNGLLIGGRGEQVR